MLINWGLNQVNLSGWMSTEWDIFRWYTSQRYKRIR